MNRDFRKYLLQITKASDCHEKEVIQTLWSGYGKISRYVLLDSTFKSVVVKHIATKQTENHPRGWHTAQSHQRKVKSYEIEEYWYEHWNQLCRTACKTPLFIGSFNAVEEQWIVMEDLDSAYPIRLSQVTLNEAKVCLKWLANFHAQFLGEKPVGLWQKGTYWHLETRQDEFEQITNKDLKQKAHLIDDLLNQSAYQTILHGDAKVANFCFSADHKKVAAVDFQYVGGGCGMKDVAYFLGSCLTGEALAKHEAVLLNYYFAELTSAVQTGDAAINCEDLVQEWHQLYPIAVADFTRFLLGWMPTHEKLNDHSLGILNRVLATL